MQRRVMRVLREAKLLAREYYALTGKPLGITGEVAEYEAARILKLELGVARQEGFDGIITKGAKKIRYQIKGRCLPVGAKPGQRLGGIKLDKKWDAVLMVLLDENFDATAIYEANRKAITKALLHPGSKARNERGSLTISKFKSIGRKRWAQSGL